MNGFHDANLTKPHLVAKKILADKSSGSHLLLQVYVPPEVGYKDIRSFWVITKVGVIHSGWGVMYFEVLQPDKS